MVYYQQIQVNWSESRGCRLVIIGQEDFSFTTPKIIVIHQ